MVRAAAQIRVAHRGLFGNLPRLADWATSGWPSWHPAPPRRRNCGDVQAARPAVSPGPTGADGLVRPRFIQMRGTADEYVYGTLGPKPLRGRLEPITMSHAGHPG